MLQKANRLTRQKDFDRVFQTGKKYYNQHLIIRAAQNPTGQSRFGIVVSAKISKKAVVRNKIKRQIRTALAGHMLNIKNGYDVVVFTQKTIIDLEYCQIEEIITRGLKKQGLLK